MGVMTSARRACRASSGWAMRSRTATANRRRGENLVGLVGGASERGDRGRRLPHREARGEAGRSTAPRHRRPRRRPGSDQLDLRPLRGERLRRAAVLQDGRPALERGRAAPRRLRHRLDRRREEHAEADRLAARAGHEMPDRRAHRAGAERRRRRGRHRRGGEAIRPRLPREAGAHVDPDGTLGRAFAARGVRPDPRGTAEAWRTDSAAPSGPSTVALLVLSRCRWDTDVVPPSLVWPHDAAGPVHARSRLETHVPSSQTGGSLERFFRACE